MPRAGFAAFAASARATAAAPAPQETTADAAQSNGAAQVPASVAAAAAAAISGRPRGKNLPVEDIKGLLESLRTASMKPDFQRELADLRKQDWGAFKKRQAFARILANAWKGAMRAAGFSINRQGFPELLATVRNSQPDVKTVSEEVERQLKFPLGALFGAKAGQMKTTSTANAARQTKGAFSQTAATTQAEEAPAPVEEEPPAVRARPLNLGEAKELLKAFKDIAKEKDVQNTLNNMERQGPAHIAKSMPFLIGQLFGKTMQDFEYPNSAEGYADMVRGIKKHGWNLHVKTAAHEVERYMRMKLGSWFTIPADEAEVEAAAAMNAAASKTRPQVAGKGEFVLVVRHAVESKELKVVLPETATFQDAKEAISKRTGREDILKRGRLVQKRGGTYSSYRDQDPVGSLREILVLGADLTVEGENDKAEEEEPQPAPPMYDAQQQGRQPAQMQEPSPAPKPKPHEQPPPTISKQQALKLQAELKAGFSGEAFQAKRRELERSGLKGMKYNAEKNKLYRTVQSIVLPKYGFRGDAKGVYDMIRAFDSFGGDEDIQKNGFEINVLLGEVPQLEPPPEEQPAPPPPQPAPPPPQPPAPPPPPPQPEKPPEEVQVTVEHALEGGSLTVTIMDNATVLELRKLVMVKLSETKISQVKIVSRLGDGYQSVPDDRQVKDKRSFLMLGRSIDLPAEPAPAAAPAAAAKEKEEEMEVTVLIDVNLGMKTSLRLKPGTSISAAKEMLAKADASGGTKVQEFGLRLPSSDKPLDDWYLIDKWTRELHYCSLAPPVEPANISGKWKMTPVKGGDAACFVLVHEQSGGNETLKGWQEGGIDIWDGHVYGDRVEWKVGGCQIKGRLKDNRWRMIDVSAKMEQGWELGPFTGEWVCTVDEAVAAQKAQQQAEAGGVALGEDVEVTIFIDRSLDLSTSMTVKTGSTVWNIKERLAGDDPTGKTQPQDFGLKSTDGTELEDKVQITGAWELEIAMKT